MILDDIKNTFAMLDEWEDRYAYVIELGKNLAPYPAEFQDDTHRIRGCASQVWLYIDHKNGRFDIKGEGDAHIVRGLIAIVIAAYNHKTPAEILAYDAFALFESLGFTEHISSQRANGLRAMIAKIRDVASHTV
jgi:cysteine desulfuration protein SufE